MSIYAKDAIGIYDRETLLTAHLAVERQCIVRQTRERHLFHQGRKRSFDFLTRKTRLKWMYTVERIHKNNVRKRTYDCSAMRVAFSKNGTPLWLVVMNGREAATAGCCVISKTALRRNKRLNLCSRVMICCGKLKKFIVKSKSTVSWKRYV